MVILDRLGWPVETVRGRPILNIIRQMIHGRRLVSRSEWKRRVAAINERMRNSPSSGTQTI